MRSFVLIAVAVLGIAVVATVAFPQDRERTPPGEENLDTGLGVGEEDFAEEPPAKPAPRPAARRRPTSSRAKTPSKAAAAAAAAEDDSLNGGDQPSSKVTTTTTTEKPVKRTRTTTQSSSSSRTSTKPPAAEDAVEEPVSTYKRPKFPPRRLPPATQKPVVVEEPLEETAVDGELQPAAGDESQNGGAVEEPIDEEPLIEEEVRR